MRSRLYFQFCQFKYWSGQFTVIDPHEMASVLTTESVTELKLKKGQAVELIIKAVHVLPVKE